MEFAEYKKAGRVFVLRFDEGDSDVIKIIEDFARSRGINAALVTLLGALKKPELVVGSKTLKGVNKPYWADIVSDDGYEVVGFGTIFPLASENTKVKNTARPVLHIHIAAGKKNSRSVVGCLRGLKDIHITIECVIQELIPSGNAGLSFVRRRRSDGVALLDKSL